MPQFFAGKFAPNCLCVIIDESRCCLLGLPLTFPWYVYVLVILSMVDFWTWIVRVEQENKCWDKLLHFGFNVSTKDAPKQSF